MTQFGILSAVGFSSPRKGWGPSRLCWLRAEESSKAESRPAFRVPITINPQNPAGLVGPGLSLRLQSDFVGPLPSTTIWEVEVVTSPEELPVYLGRFRSNQNPFFVTLQVPDSTIVLQSDPSEATTEGKGVSVNAHLQETGNPPDTDEGTVPGTWSNTAGLTKVIQSAPNSTGLTPEEAAQLDAVDNSVSVTVPIDATVPISSGIHPPGATISAQLAFPIFGLIVRIAEIPEGLEAQTPDGVYFVKTLAVATIFDGTDIWMRVPIHTPTKIVPFFTDLINAAVAQASILTRVADLSYQVAFGEGVSGEVVELHFP